MSDATLDEFIALWEKEFGEQIDRGDAEVRAKQVVHLFEQLLAHEASRQSEEPNSQVPIRKH